MKTIECNVLVHEDRKAVVQLPSDITPGQHRLVVVVDEETFEPGSDPLEGFPTIRLDHWPQDLALRREDMYGDDGR